jgi:hypothetical protein
MGALECDKCNHIQNVLFSSVRKERPIMGAVEVDCLHEFGVHSEIRGGTEERESSVWSRHSPLNRSWFGNSLEFSEKKGRAEKK